MLSQLRSAWSSLTRRARFESDLKDEIRFHIERRAEDLVRAGMPTGEAIRRARTEFGGIEQYREECRRARGLRFFDELMQDIRYAFRTMQRKPGFVLVAVGSLALGIGANSAIFSVLDAVLLRQLPVYRPDELFAIHQQAQPPVPQRWSWPMYERLRLAIGSDGESAAVSRIARVQTAIKGDTQDEPARLQLVSDGYFNVLGVGASAGRLFLSSDNRAPGGHPVAVISDGFWRRRFGESPSAAGSQIVINGFPFTIIGIARQGFTGVWLESPADVWVPLMMQREVRYSQNYSADNYDPGKPWPMQEQVSWLEVIVRPKPGRSARVLAGLNTELQRQLAQQVGRISNPDQRKLFLQQRLGLEPFAKGFSNLRAQFGPPLVALMAAAALVLLIACANIANLLLARAAGRQREIAVRISIGAGRGRLVRQLLTESLVLAVAGASLGLLVAGSTSALLVRTATAAVSPAAPIETGVDGRVLLFTAALTIATAILFGLVPALRTTAAGIAPGLQSGTRTVHGSGRLTLTNLLVAGQVALSLLLVTGAALFLESFRRLTTVDAGFEPEHVLSAQLDLRKIQYRGERLEALYDRLRQRMEGIPGVRSASNAMCGIAAGCRSRVSGIQFTGYLPKPGEDAVVQENRVGLNYFATVGMHVIEGRDFEARDSAGASRVAIVNQALARRYFAGRSAVGQRFGEEKADIEIIGVVHDARVNSLREAAVPMAYYPLAQGVVQAETLEVRVEGDPRSAAAAVRRAIAEVDSNLRVDRLTPLTQQVDVTLIQDRLVAGLSSAFGLLALLLACFGLYGVLSYAVSRRTAELGVRFALGASRARVLWQVLRDSMALVVAGLVAGGLLTLAGSRLLSGILFDVNPRDPRIVGFAALILLVSAAASGYLPAWRASRVEPAVALRWE